ncbi:cell death-inducing p53-target protein 1-like [Takifugu flavidus]|uniref:cell death-inducing p53-target protein 1-like n=1 Tax=Takifugu flavidus TaxID=433684 RepID=UPI0025443B77|nr:cell death-inducing p53-target protein 1-like [Takifugu flavidus]
MDSLSKVDEPFPTPPPYFLPESRNGQEVRVYHIHSPFSPPPPPPSFSSPGAACTTQTQLPLQGSTMRPKLVSYETRLHRNPGLTTCPSCRTQVTSLVTYKVGLYAWFMCFVFVFCGLLLGCCLIPFFVNFFKDAYHTCPRCQRVLHIHRKTCCE